MKSACAYGYYGVEVDEAGIRKLLLCIIVFYNYNYSKMLVLYTKSKMKDVFQKYQERYTCRCTLAVSGMEVMTIQFILHDPS